MCVHPYQKDVTSKCVTIHIKKMAHQNVWPSTSKRWHIKMMAYQNVWPSTLKRWYIKMMAYQNVWPSTLKRWHIKMMAYQNVWPSTLKRWYIKMCVHPHQKDGTSKCVTIYIIKMADQNVWPSTSKRWYIKMCVEAQQKDGTSKCVSMIHGQWSSTGKKTKQKTKTFAQQNVTVWSLLPEKEEEKNHLSNQKTQYWRHKGKLASLNGR